MSAGSWREIAETIGMDITECTKMWKNMRYKYVCPRGKLTTTKSENPERKLVPALYWSLSWLASHIKHQGTTSW